MTVIRNRRVGAVLLLSAIGGAGHAVAAGFYIQEQSAAGVGRAQAGNVVAADDASTIFFNAAGLTELPGVQAAGGIDLIIPSAGITDTGTRDRSTGAYLANPASGGFSAPGGGNGGNPGSPTPVPDLYFSAHIPDSDFTVGLGLSAPFGFVSKFASNSFARYDSIDSEVTTIDIAPTVAWKVNDWLSLGAGVDIQYADVKLTSALPNALALGGPTPATDGLLQLKGNTWTTGFNVGLLLKPAAGTKLGFSYRSAIIHQIDGKVTFSGLTGPLAARNGTIGGDAALDLPDIATAGISQQISPQLTLLGEVDYYKWSNFKQIDIVLGDGSGSLVTAENYRDTYSVALGAEYQLTEALKLRAGVKYDQTPTVAAYRDTRVPDGDRYWIAGGVHYTLNDHLALDASYAHIFVDSENINVSRSFYATAPFPIPTGSTISAQSNVALDIVTVGFSYKF